MIGDGVNDVPALKEARLAIAQGSGRADVALGRRPRARARRLRRRARDGRRGTPDPAQHPACGAAVHHQDRVHGGGGRGSGDPDGDLPAPAAPVHDRLYRHDRHSRVRARARAELGAVAAGALSSGRSSASRSRPGSGIGIGIIAGYLLARYGFDLGLRALRTVATGIVVVCGLAVVMRLEGESGRRRLAVAGLVRADGAALRPRALRPLPARLLRALNPDRRRRRSLGAGKQRSESGTMLGAVAPSAGRTDRCDPRAVSRRDDRRAVKRRRTPLTGVSAGLAPDRFIEVRAPGRRARRGHRPRTAGQGAR